MLLRVAAILVVLLSSTKVVVADESIVLSTHLVPNGYYYNKTEAILMEAFSRAGYQVSLKPVPGERALKEADAGISDGDAHRITDIIERRNLNNLVKVPEVQQVVSDYAWTKNILDFDGRWESLSQYKVGVHLGSVLLVEKAQQYSDNVYVVSKVENLFRMLAKGRLDIVITVPGNAEILKTEEYSSSGIRRVGEPMTTLPIYTYLHNKHTTLAMEVAEALRQMKEDGSYAEILQEFE